MIRRKHFKNWDLLSMKMTDGRAMTPGRKKLQKLQQQVMVHNATKKGRKLFTIM